MRDAHSTFRAIFAAALVAGAAAGQTLLWTIPGPPNTPSSQFGKSVAGGGDVNGDGFPDFVVGDPGANAISIYSGYDGTLLHFETGSGSFGASVAILGDGNGDGLADVLIGAPTAVQGSVTVGAVRYVFGGTFSGGTGYGPPIPPLGFVNLSPEFGFGAHVAAAGDVNSDGLADAIVSRPGRCELTLYNPINCVVMNPGFSYAGDATVFAGGTVAVLHQIAGSSGEPFARVAAGIGDVDLDGFDDFALLSGGWGGSSSVCFFVSSTCPAFSLRLSVRSGATGAQLWSYTSSWGRKPCLAAVGDLNGDQRSELLVRANTGTFGAWLQVNTILSGVDGSVILTYSENLSPMNPVELSGAGVGDVDGDGVADYVMGDAVNFGVNRVRVFSGASHALLYTLDGGSTSGFGASIAGLGDLNGDGRGEYAVGSVGGWSAPPSVQVFSGVSLPVASVITLGGGCGAGGGVPVLTVSPPVIGASTTIALAGAPYPAAGLLVTSAIPAVPNIVSGGPAFMDQCPVFVDFPTVAVVVSFTTGPAGDWSLVVPLPNVPAIAGNPVALTAGLSPALGGFAASNTVVATPGY